jgi:Protein of unknown function (DUF3551)
MRSQMMRMMMTIAVVIAAVEFGPPPMRVYQAPWCAVISMGRGEAYWDCQYRTVEECVPVVISGNRGFCNPNPAYVGELVPTKKHKARHKRPAG